MSRLPAQSSLAVLLLATTMLTQPATARAAPGDALGREFQVNTTTASNQRFPAIAMDADGDFVVVWAGQGPGDADGIFAQRYTAAGEAQGGEFRVNIVTTDIQDAPAVAMDTDGDFVVAWQSFGQDGGGHGIFAQRFDASGSAQGSEIPVNTFTTGNQNEPAVAMDADGDFVVAWQSFGQDGAGYGIFAQRFDAAGSTQGSEIPVNTNTLQSQSNPAVAMDAEGHFILAWHGPQLISGQDIFARRYDVAGVAQGGEFQINSFATGTQQLASVAMDADGDFAVVWQSYLQDGSTFGIFGQRFDAAGAVRGPEFQVNTVTAGSQQLPSVAMDADGDFAVVWQSELQDGSAFGIFARRFDAAGAARGPGFQVNSLTAGDQDTSAVAMDADGDFVVAWQSYGQDGSGYGVFAQRFDEVERLEADFDGDGNADILWRRSDNGNTSMWLMDGTTRLSATPTANPGTDWQVAGTADFNGDAKADILWRRSDNGNIDLWLMDGATRLAKRQLNNPGTAWAVEELRDTNGDGLADIVWRKAATGETVVWQMSISIRLDGAQVGNAGSPWQVQ